MKAGLAIAFAFVFTMVMAFVGYWIVARINVDQQYQVNIHSQQQQAAWVTQERDEVHAISAATDPGQIALLTDNFCSVYVNLTHPPQDLIDAHVLYCHGGNQ